MFKLPFTVPFIEPIAGLAGAWWKAAVGAAVVAAPIFLMGQCSGAHIEKGRAKAALAVAVVAAVTKGAALNETAAGERLAGEKAVTTRMEDLSNAVAAIPDAAPSARRVALGCARLRAQGAAVSSLPAVCRPEGGAQAGPGAGSAGLRGGAGRP